MSNTLPLFTSHYGFKSLLTLDPPTKKKGEPNERSVFHLAKKYGYPHIVVIDKWPGGIQEGTINSQECGIGFTPGLEMIVCSDMTQKDEASRNTESKINILAKNDEGVKDLNKLFSYAATEGKYYVPRLDWNALKERWTDNLSLAIPFYDSFLHNNYLARKTCFYEPPCQAVFYEQENGLPFDPLLSDKLHKAAKIIVPVKTIYYEKKDDFLIYQTYRCSTGRKGQSVKTLNKPNLNHFCSDRFCLEDLI